MTPYFEKIDQLLVKKTGKKVCELDYAEPPEEDARYNTMLSIGNIHLVAGRIKTKRKADILINKFLNTKIL